MGNIPDLRTLLGKVLLDKYLLKVMIGEGGFGGVFLAEHLEENKAYAIKVLYVNEKLSEERRAKLLQYFQREIGILRRIKHENIVAIYEDGITEYGQPFLVMELAEGRLLSELLDTMGQLSISLTVRIVSQLCYAISAMHNEGIIHRDLKPDNVMVGGTPDNEQIKLLDFGLAKLVRGGSNEKWLQTLTARNRVQGTIFYMSPEQCESQKLDERTDIYSLGIMAYEMLTGKPPFQAPSPIATMMAHLETPPPPLRSKRADLPGELDNAILKALEKDRNDRYSSAKEFADTLLALVHQNSNVPASDVEELSELIPMLDLPVSTGDAPVEKRRHTVKTSGLPFEKRVVNVTQHMEKVPTSKNERIKKP